MIINILCDISCPLHNTKLRYMYNFVGRIHHLKDPKIQYLRMKKNQRLAFFERYNLIFFQYDTCKSCNSLGMYKYVKSSK